VDSKAVFQLSLRKYNEGVALFPDCSPVFCHVLYVIMSCMERSLGVRVQTCWRRVPETYPEFIPTYEGLANYMWT